jgi:hypothetical protein
MQVRPLLTYVLSNDALTRGLGDAEARVLIEWLVERAENLAHDNSDEETAWKELRRFCRRGQAIRRFVSLWCYEDARGAAGQLAAAERFQWPLPTTAVDACELMHAILSWETSEIEQKAALAA